MTDSPELDALIVGAGFNGVYQLHRLRNEGFRVRLVEAGSGLGGVWHNNCYPGARVDSHVPNYEFSMPEIWQDWVWEERFPGREELVRYFDHVDSIWNLRPDIDFDTRVASATFDESANRWDVTATNGTSYRTQHLIMCTGFGSQPYVPDLPGLADFAGPCHHTARWPADGLPFDNRRVGVIGTGASGVQVVQEAAKSAAHLTVFQRTPVTALPMQQRRLDPAQQAADKAGYPAMFEQRNAPPGSFSDIHRVNKDALSVTKDERLAVFEEKWALGGFHFWVGTFRDVLSNEDANRTAYAFWRDKTRARIDDPVTAALLAPDEPPYPFGTKRPSLEQTYYDCFNQPNVDLVGLHAAPIERITSHGLIAGGETHELDILVLATGFDANTGGLTAIDITGTDGTSLADTWSDGVDTHLGVAVTGFPNVLMLYGPQSASSFCNGPVCAELQGDWVIDLLLHMREQGAQRHDAAPDTGPAWSEHMAEVATMSLFAQADSWYMGANIPGKRRQLLNYPNSDAYLDQLRRCSDADYEGFVFS